MSSEEIVWFFERFDYFRSVGRGVSVYNAAPDLVAHFAQRCRSAGVAAHTICASELQTAVPDRWQTEQVVLVHQDLSGDELLNVVELLVNRIIFPLWYRRRTICFFSAIDRSAYLAPPGLDAFIHTDLRHVVRCLLREQLVELLERVNYQFTHPEFLALSPDKMVYTPIEERLRTALEDKRIVYQPQVRFGRYFVDFVVSLGNRQVIVECDGRAYHTPERDAARDQALALEGMPIVHLSGARIWADLDGCIEEIRRAAGRPAARHEAPVDPDLDDSQRAAIRTLTGPVRVLAPAGSGKTKTLVNYVAALVNNGVAPKSILALAFNTRARNEMAQRLREKGLSDVEVRTFHSLGYQIVREQLGWNFDENGYEKRERALLDRALKRAGIELPPRRNRDPLDAFLDALRRTKMELPPVADVTVEFEDRVIPFTGIFDHYIDLQWRHTFLTFDDMIYLALRLLLRNLELRRWYQQRFEYVLVDEFQDLNRAQLLMLQLLWLPDNNIFVVGDDDQMIYGWRGAEVRELIDFPQRFAVTSDHTLAINYRSARAIVRHSRWLIEHNRDRVPKDIRPRRDAAEGLVDIQLGDDLWQQAQAAAAWIESLHKEHGVRWRDCAVLFRFKDYQYPMALALDARGIPHSPVNGRRLFRTPVGADLYAYLTVVLHPKDAGAEEFARILKRPNKYFKNEIIEKATDWDAFRRLPDLPDLRGWERDKLADFVTRIETLQAVATRAGVTPQSLLLSLDEELGLRAFYRDQTRLSGELDEASDEVLLDVVLSVAATFARLDQFYGYVHHAHSDDGEEADDADGAGRDEVTITTIHRAKGNEFDYVVWFNASVPPQGEDAQNEEERRVAYVAATRGRHGLLVTATRERPSRFVKELALNPAFAGVSEVLLGRERARAEQRILDLRRQINTLTAEHDRLLARFPELQGRAVAIGFPLFRGWMRRRRERKVDDVAARVDEIRTRIARLMDEEMAVAQEQIAAIDTETRFRNLLTTAGWQAPLG